jgi:hypothetical protein
MGGWSAADEACMQVVSRASREKIGREVGSGGGRGVAAIRTVRPMTAPRPAARENAESDWQTEQSESDPHRQGQYAWAAADAAAEVSMDAGASAADRERAQAILRSSLALIPGSLIRQAQTALTASRGETHPERQHELARAAAAMAGEAVGRREVTDDERAQARQLISGARLIVNTIAETAMRQRSTARGHEHQPPGIAI